MEPRLGNENVVHNIADFVTLRLDCCARGVQSHAIQATPHSDTSCAVKSLLYTFDMQHEQRELQISVDQLDRASTQLS